MYLARHHTKDSYPDLGAAFGGKHHTTVISAVQKIENAGQGRRTPALRDPRDRRARASSFAVTASLCAQLVEQTVWTNFGVGVVHILCCMSSTRKTGDVSTLCACTRNVERSTERVAELSTVSTAPTDPYY